MALVLAFEVHRARQRYEDTQLIHSALRNKNVPFAEPPFAEPSLSILR